MVTTAEQPATAEKTEKDVSPRARLVQWVRAELKDIEEVNLVSLRDRARKHLTEDHAFLKRLLDDLLDGALYEVVQQVVGSSRHLVIYGDDIRKRQDDGSPPAAPRVGLWSKWLEHVGDKHVRLGDMRKEDLLTAALEREKRANTERDVAALWRALAAKLDEGQRVRERFSDAEIEAVRASLQTDAG